MTRTALGVLGAALLLAVAGLGWRLYKRYRAAIQYEGIGRPYPIGNSVLAFIGFGLVLFGLIAAAIVAMITFR